MLKSKKGFTLIELVMVIVILAILAAVAVPRFIDLKADASKATAKGVASGIMGAATMLHAQYLVKGTTYMFGTTERAVAANDTDLIGAAGISGGATISVLNPGLIVAANTYSSIYIGGTGWATYYTMYLTINDTKGPSVQYFW